MLYNYCIIIPHKNSPLLLERCLNSIPSRNDTQIVIVDDNSDSKIVNFDRFPGLTKLNTTCVFDKSGKGAGHARNVGLKYAQSKWIIFSDSDDFFSDNINRILDAHINSDSDLTYYCINSVYSDNLKPCNRADNYTDKFYYALTHNDFDLLRYKMTTPWAKIIDVDLIRENNICFDETPVSNDAWFSLLVGHFSKKVKIEDVILYTLTENKNSLMHQNKVDKIWCRLMVAGKINDFLIDHNLDKYHVNLFAYEYYFAKCGLKNIFKAFVYSIKHTPCNSIVVDLWRCFISVIFPSKRKLG